MKTLFFFLSILTSLDILSLNAEEVHKQTLNQAKNSLIIDPKMRALDYQQAYETLRKEKPSNKVCVTLMNGLVFSNIIEMQRMANSTLFLIRYNSPQGIKIQAVELELIQSIGYLE